MNNDIESGVCYFLHYPNHNNFRGQFYIMQALERRTQRVSISVSPEIKERILSLKRGNQTYDDVLGRILETVAVDEKGEDDGVIFMNSVYINGDLKKLKQSIPLKVHISDKGMIHLSNTEYKILVSCKTLQEALEEAQTEYDTMFKLFNNSETPKSDSAANFGLKLKESVWI